MMQRLGACFGILLAILNLVHCSALEAQPQSNTVGVAASQPYHASARPTATLARPFQQFVTRDGTRLMVGDTPFRFAGTNIYWLALDENVGGVNYPTPFRVHNVLATAREMGATVVRTHGAISTGCALCIMPERGVANEEAFQKLDYAIASSGQYGIRLILPLTDQYEYYHGGIADFAAWRGLPAEAFYSDQQVIDDFKAYVSLILNRVNTITGVAYKDDPTILAWETGNELRPTAQWTQQIADHIKQVDPHHLVVDGNSMIEQDALSLASLDIFTLHFYPMNVKKLEKGVEKVRRAGKVFAVGEYDWNNYKGGDDLPTFLDAIASNQDIAGDLYWCLFGHHDASGYVYSNKGYRLHYPGETSAIRQRAAQLRAHAFEMAGLKIPPHSLPPAPVLTQVGRQITWQGVVGGDTYTIERSTHGPDGPWTIVCDRCVTDSDGRWNDRDRLPNVVWYRIKAYNVDGLPGSYSIPRSTIGT